MLVEFDMDSVIRQAIVTIAFGYASRQHGANGTVYIGDRSFDFHRLTTFQRGFGLLYEFVVQCLVEAMILHFVIEDRYIRTGLGHMQHERIIQSLGLPVVNRSTHVEHVHTAGHFPELAEAVAKPLSKVDKITVVNTGGDGSSAGVSKVTDEVGKILAQMPVIIESLSGVDVKKLLEKLPQAGGNPPEDDTKGKKEDRVGAKKGQTKGRRRK